MGIIENLKFVYYRKKIVKYAGELCYHMINVNNYLYKNNQYSRKEDRIREAVALTGSWQKTTDNVFKNTKSGESMEINSESDLYSTTKKILEIEIKQMVKNMPENLVSNLLNLSYLTLDEYFKENYKIK